MIVFTGPCEACLSCITMSRRGAHSNGFHHVRWMEVWTGRFCFLFTTPSYNV